MSVFNLSDQEICLALQVKCKQNQVSIFFLCWLTYQSTEKAVCLNFTMSTCGIRLRWLAVTGDYVQPGTNAA